MELLKWAHYNGCPWDARTDALAVEMGHTELSQWIRENGCPRFGRRI